MEKNSRDAQHNPLGPAPSPLGSSSTSPGRRARIAPEMSLLEEFTQLDIANEAATPTRMPRSYASAIQRFIDWGGLLPTTDEVILKYLAQHAQVLNSRTLAHWLSAIGSWHQWQGFDNPVKSPEVRRVMRGIQRLYGKPKEKSDTLTREALECVVNLLENDTSITARRDNALLQLGFFGDLTVSELVSLCVEDLMWDPPSLKVALPNAQISKVHHRIHLVVPFEPPGTLCAPTAIRTWLRESSLESGPIFRPISRHGHLRSEQLSAGAVSLILVRRAIEAALPNAGRLSGISLRQHLKANHR